MLGTAARRIKEKILELLTGREAAYEKYDQYHYVEIRGEDKVDLVHRADVPEEYLTGKHRQMSHEELREQPPEEDEEKDVNGLRDGYSFNRGNERMKQARSNQYSQESAKKTAKRATNNRHIFNDVMNDPGVVEADSQVEALAQIAESNPGWLSNVEVSDINPDISNSDVEAEMEDGDAGQGSDAGEDGSDGAGDGDVSMDGPTVKSNAEAALNGGDGSGDAGSSGDGGDAGDSGGMGDGGMGSGGMGDGGI
ncbi:hypothetical protein [Haloarcula litorea]|uniref:hypothetical protein n=1 Tax=Haloarcula litorea TaxID=3032579 RepID=UPI0023E7B077|nr:hypothetical protein [Halomicroarcula sp. GDY20]